MADVTINQLNTGTPDKNSAVIPYSDGTTTLKTSPSGIVAASPGSVIQVQTYLYESSIGYGNTNSWDLFFVCSFTPRVITSKVLIQASFMVSGNGGIRLRRNDIELFHPWSTRPEYAPGQPSADQPYMLWDYYSAQNQSGWNNGSQRGVCNFNVIDNPNTLNNISYNFDVKAYPSAYSGLGFNEMNRKTNGNPGAPSNVLIWEIAG